MKTAVVAAMVLIGLIGGCGVDLMEERVEQDQEQPMGSRPSMDELEERYLGALREFQRRISDEVPGVVWKSEPSRDDEGLCLGPDDESGVSRNYRDTTTTTPFDHSQWPVVEKIADEVAQKYQFSADKAVIVDKQDYHKISWFSADGGELYLGASKFMDVGILGACTTK